MSDEFARAEAGIEIPFHDVDLKAGLQCKAPVESLTLYRFQRALKKGSGIEAPTLHQILEVIPESQPVNLDIKRRSAEIGRAHV